MRLSVAALHDLLGLFDNRPVTLLEGPSTNKKCIVKLVLEGTLLHRQEWEKSAETNYEYKLWDERIYNVVPPNVFRRDVIGWHRQSANRQLVMLASAFAPLRLILSPEEVVSGTNYLYQCLDWDSQIVVRVEADETCHRYKKSVRFNEGAFPTTLHSIPVDGMFITEPLAEFMPVGLQLHNVKDGLAIPKLLGQLSQIHSQESGSCKLDGFVRSDFWQWSQAVLKASDQGDTDNIRSLVKRND